MSVYDFEEQEQLARLAAWWKDNGRLVILAVVVLVATVGGIYGWRYYQTQQSLAAAQAYATLQPAILANDVEKLQAGAAELRSRYPRSPYAARAALAAAKASYERGDLESAKGKLNWVMEQAREEALRATARLRLARILLEEGKFDQALTLLPAEDTTPYARLYDDLRGDVLAAQGKREEARKAYQRALEKTGPGEPLRNLIELKLDALEGA
jgi:predicted negative regulator of RcsB-dependent stress response